MVAVFHLLSKLSQETLLKCLFFCIHSHVTASSRRLPTPPYLRFNKRFQFRSFPQEKHFQWKTRLCMRSWETFESLFFGTELHEKPIEMKFSGISISGNFRWLFPLRVWFQNDIFETRFKNASTNASQNRWKLLVDSKVLMKRSHKMWFPI